jgi:hypothetical protein
MKYLKKPSVIFNFLGIVLWIIGFSASKALLYPWAWYFSISSIVLLVLGGLVWFIWRLKLVKYLILALKGKEIIEGKFKFSIKEELKEFAITIVVQGLALIFAIWIGLVFFKRWHYSSSSQFDLIKSELNEPATRQSLGIQQVERFGIRFDGDLNFAGGGAIEFTAIQNNGKAIRLIGQVIFDKDNSSKSQINIRKSGS